MHMNIFFFSFISLWLWSAARAITISYIGILIRDCCYFVHNIR